LPSVLPKPWLDRTLGLSLGADYNILLQHASESPGINDAVGGVARLYGKWKPFNSDAVNASSLVFKLENRHRIDAPIAPNELGPAVGYAGLTAVPFSDAGNVLTNLYWYQGYNENRFAFVAGIVDVTDYVDVYGLVRHCQTNLTEPAKGADLKRSGCQLTPFRECGSAVLFEGVAAVEVAVEVEMVVD